MPECSRCGTFVTGRFARVFGDNDGEVYGCLDCATIAELFEGRPAGDDDR